jgi:hypothetical protein
VGLFAFLFAPLLFSHLRGDLRVRRPRADVRLRLTAKPLQLARFSFGLATSVKTANRLPEDHHSRVPVNSCSFPSFGTRVHLATNRSSESNAPWDFLGACFSRHDYLRSSQALLGFDAL